MLQRCYNPKSVEYPRYGGRGIRVYERWRTSYFAYLQYIGQKTEPEYSLDR
jgi:hypothetical protein